MSRAGGLGWLFPSPPSALGRWQVDEEAFCNSAVSRANDAGRLSSAFVSSIPCPPTMAATVLPLVDVRSWTSAKADRIELLQEPSKRFGFPPLPGPWPKSDQGGVEPHEGEDDDEQSWKGIG